MVEVEVVARGDVSEHAREAARAKVAVLERYVKGPILRARVVLTQERNPRIPDPARAEAEVDLQGRLVRARAAAASMDAAVDDVAERLARNLQRYVERMIEAQRGSAAPAPGEWSHRSRTLPRTTALERPAEERELRRRKSFAAGAMSVDEAADALEDLDHEFFLFHDADTDADALLYWREDGRLALMEATAAGAAILGEPSRLSQPIALEAAIEEMNAVGHRYLFFENVRSGRANVIYRRDDGHYGLIEPAGG